MAGRPLNGERPSIRHVSILLAGLVMFLGLAILNDVRDFMLWRNYSLASILIGGVVTYLIWRHDARLPGYIQGMLVLMVLLHLGGGSTGSPNHDEPGLLGMHGINGAYHVFSWWDHLTHGVGVAAGAMGFAYILEVYQYRRSLDWSPRALWFITVLCALSSGVAMELYEFLGKTAFATIDQGGYVNTMNDLHFNTIGAVAGATIAVSINRTAYRERIEAQWGDQRREPTEGRFFARLPPRMLGLLAFVGVLAATSTFLAAQYFLLDIPDPDLPLYDRALATLSWSAVVALGAFFVTTVAAQGRERGTL